MILKTYQTEALDWLAKAGTLMPQSTGQEKNIFSKPICPVNPQAW